MNKGKPGKRGNGEGSPRQRSDGRWEWRYRTPDGRQRSVYGKTRREAQQKMREAQRAHENGLDAARGRQTVAAFLDDWLAHAQPRIRPKTYRFYEQIVRVHLKPCLGRHRLDSLGPQHVQAFLNRQAAKDLSPQTVRHHRDVLRCALEQAVKWRLMERNVAKLADPPRLSRAPVQPLSAQQARLLIERCRTDRLGPLFQVAIATGMRQGELFGLRWEDVDWGRQTLAVQRALQRIDGRPTFVEPKTVRSRRVIPLPGLALQALRAQEAIQRENRLVAGDRWEEWGLVFASARGTPLDASNVNAQLRKLLEKAGLPRQRFHNLRHCSASLLLHAGVDMRTIMGRLGHSQLSLTMNTYAHLSPELERNAATALDRLLSEAP
jgi:integrase